MHHASNTPRDPRHDPNPGDELMSPRHYVREVVSVEQGTAWPVIRYRHATGTGYATLDQWRKWAKTAEVVKVAE